MSYVITDACIGCTLCARNCPVRAITGKVKEKHVIDPGLCVDCGLCGRLCAKGAVEDGQGRTAERQPKDQWKKPVIDRESCAGCQVCVENCPKFCLEITGPAFHGDIHTVAELVRPSDCIGCGLCAGTCPIGAIEMSLPR